MADANTGEDRRDDASKASPFDKTVKPAGAQSAPAVVSAPEPEATIIEETITRPAPPKTPAPSPLPPKPTPPSPAAPPPPVPVPPTPSPAPIPVPPPIAQTAQPSIAPPVPPPPTPANDIVIEPAGLFIPPELATEKEKFVPHTTLSSSALSAGISPIVSPPKIEPTPDPIPPASPLPPKPIPPPAPVAPPPPAPPKPEPTIEAPKSAAPIIPAAAPVQGSTFVPRAPSAQDNPPEFAKILEEVKIPERRAQTPQKESERVFDTKLGTVEEMPKTPTASSAPVQSSLTSAIVAPLRTLKNDLQQIVRVNKISLVRAAALEQEKRYGHGDEPVREARPRSHRVTAIIFSISLLLIVSAGALLGVYMIEQQRGGSGPHVEAASILFSESAVSLPLGTQSALELKRLLAEARLASSATLGSITRIVPIVSETNAEGLVLERPSTLEEFMIALGTRASPDLLRALSPDFFFGIHTVDENAPILVIPVTSYEHAFAGMLAWEQTMNADLAPIYSQVPDQVLGAGGLPQKRLFNDVVMRNYDVRALKDDSDIVQLYYSFPTQNILIIGESPYSFTEVLSRLRAERKL